MSEDVLERLIREAEGEGSDTPPPPEAASASETTEAGASPLLGLLSHPAVLTALPTLLGGMGGGKKALPAVKKHPDRHTALLCAIKPYLGKERQQTADQLIGLCRVWDTLQGTGILQLLPGLLGGHAAGDAVGVAAGEPSSAEPEEV